MTKWLDEILRELANITYQHGKATGTNTPFHYGEPVKEAEQAILKHIEEAIGEDVKATYCQACDDSEGRATNQLRGSINISSNSSAGTDFK